METRVSKYLAENGPSSAYSMKSSEHLDYSPINKAFNSLESDGLLFRTGIKSEHGAEEFDFTPLGALYAFRRGGFDYEKAFRFWEQNAPDHERDSFMQLMKQMQASLGLKEFGRLSARLFELLLYTHAAGGSDNQILGQLAGFTADNPTLNILPKNPKIQQALKKLQQNYAHPGIMPLDKMYAVWETKRKHRFRKLQN